MTAATAPPQTAAMFRRLLQKVHKQNHRRHTGLSEWDCPLGDCPGLRHEIEKAESDHGTPWYERWVG